MKIGILTTSLPRNETDTKNAGIFVLDFASLLKKHGIEVEIVSPHSSYFVGIKTFKIPFFSAESSISHLSVRKFLDFVKLFLFTVSGILYTPFLSKKNNWDFVFAFWVLPSGLFAFINRLVNATPYAIWALGSDVWEAKSYPLGRKLFKISSKFASMRFADGFKLASDAKKLSDIDFEFLASSRLPLITEGPSRIFFSKRYFLAVGRLHHHKGFDNLIRAYAKLNSEVNEAPDLYIFGEGPELSHLIKLVLQLDLEGKVHLPGILDPIDYRDALINCEKFIISSNQESLPLILSDAARLSSSILATDVGDIGDLLRRFECGMVVKPGVESLYEGLAKNHKENTTGLRNLAAFMDLENSISIFKNHLLHFLDSKSSL